MKKAVKLRKKKAENKTQYKLSAHQLVLEQKVITIPAKRLQSWSFRDPRKEIQTETLNMYKTRIYQQPSDKIHATF